MAEIPMAPTLLLTHDPQYDQASIRARLVSPYGNVDSSQMVRQTLMKMFYQVFLHLKVEEEKGDEE